MAAVQALTPAPAAYTSPATSFTSLPTPMTASWGAGALHQRLSAFVKKSLIQQLVPTGAVVCDLYCGRGVDTENWAEAHIGKYVGVDLSSSALEEAKEQWEKNGKPFVARFCELNPCMADLEKHLGEDRLSADIVTCLAHLQDCFASEDMVHQLLKNVASLLKPGGYFFGATPDSSTIWYKYQKAVEGAMKAGSLRANGHLPRVKTDLYSISFEDDRFNQYGSRYQLRFTDDTVPPQPQILVHFPSLIRRAEELGLEYVEIQNLTEFYEDYRVPFAETLQKSCGTLVDAKGNPVVDGKSRLSPIAQDVLSLYTTFIFKKPDPQQRLRALKRPAPAPAPASADVKKNKNSSPALPVRVPGSEVTPSKRRKISASPAIATSNGSKLQETIPIQEKNSSTASRSKPVNLSESKSQERVSKLDVANSEARGFKSMERLQKTESPGASKPKASGGQRTESPSTSKAKVPVGVRTESPSASQAKVTGGLRTESPSTSQAKVTGGQRTESPSESKPIATGGQRTESPSATKSKALEGQITGSPNLRIQELKAEGFQPSKSNMHGSSDPDADRPNSGGLRSENHQRSEIPEPEKRKTERQANESGHVQEPVKRKRVSRWSSDYVPKAVASSTAGQNSLKKDEGVPLQQFGLGPNQPRVGASPKIQIEGDVVLKFANSVRESQVVSGAPQFRERYDNKERNTNRDSSRPLKGSHERRSLLPNQEHRNGKEDTQVKEEGEIVPDHPVRKASSPKRDRPVVAELHYERRAAQRLENSETVSGSIQRRETVASESENFATRNAGSVGSETRLEGSIGQNNDSKVGPGTQKKSTVSEPESQRSTASRSEDLATDARPQEISIQESTSTIPEDVPGNPQKGMGVSSSTPTSGLTGSEAKKESLNPKPRKKDVAMDVLMERTSNQSKGDTATCATQTAENTGTEVPSEKSSATKKESASSEPPQFGRESGQKSKDSATGDVDFEKGSKLSRDSPAPEHQSEARVKGAKRDFEPAWETKPQRYTLRRQQSLGEVGGSESPPLWPNRGAFPLKINRDQQGRGPVFHPRIPYVNPVSGFAAAPRPPLRAAERSLRGPVPPLQGVGVLPGLLGAAPSPIFGERGLPGDRRFDLMGPPEGSRGYSHSPNDHRGPRSIRGSLYNERVAAGPRGPSEFAQGEGPHSSASNGLGAPWEDHFQGDGRTRNR